MAIFDKKEKTCYKVGYITNDVESKLPFYLHIMAGDDVIINLWEASDILELATGQPHQNK